MPDRPHRSFTLRLPSLTGDRRTLTVELPSRYYVPKLLEIGGLAEYERRSMAAWLAILEQDRPGSAFDVGANVGPYSWVAASLATRRVVAFEPAPDLLSCVGTVAAMNDLNILLEQIALSDSDGQAMLYLSDHTDSSHSLAEGFRRSSASLTVLTQRVDTYVHATGLIPHVMKIDTETYEPQVLSGAIETIREHRPWLIVEVLAGRTEDRTMEAMNQHDYCWYHLNDEIPPPRSEMISGDKTYEHNNWLLTPTEPDQSFWTSYAAWNEALSVCGPAAD